MALEIFLAILGTLASAFGAYRRDVLVVGVGATLLGLALIAAWLIAG
jgi:hypothetical protein